MIPKIFHLTHKTGNLAPQFQKNVDRIRELYPEYEVRIHDDQAIRDFVSQYYPDYHADVLSKMPQFIMVVDTVRYLWMQHWGGVYADVDVFFNKRFEYGSGVFFAEREWTHPRDPSITHSVHNAWFASEPGHAVWQEILDGIAANVRGLAGKKPRPKKASFIRKATSKALRTVGLQKPYQPLVFDVTGPNAISKIITEKNLVARHPDLRIEPGAVIYQHGWSKGTRQDAFCVHETAGSWMS